MVALFEVNSVAPSTILGVRPLNSFTCKVIEFMLTTSPELVFHSAGVKELIGRRTSLQGSSSDGHRRLVTLPESFYTFGKSHYPGY